MFENLSLEFKGAGLHALFGPSGVGKSTLAQIISGLIPTKKGHVVVEGGEIPLYAHNMERLPGWSSVGRHFERVTPDCHKDLKSDLLHIFELNPLLNQRFDQLSMGQQNRVNLVRYLLQDLKVLLMDETLANVDEKLRSHILMSIKEIFPQRLFIYISHNVVEVATYCRDIWVLRAHHKHPHAVRVQGQDQVHGRTADHGALQKSMLEIMNAA